MKLSALLLYEKLEKIVVSYSFGENAKQLNLNRPELFRDNTHLESGHLYIVRAEKLPKDLSVEDGSCIICLGQPLAECTGHGGTIIYLSADLDIFDIFNRLHAIFDCYDDWERRLLQCVNEKTPMQRFIDVSTSIFENPMYIIDSTLKQLAKSRHSAFSQIPFNIIAEDIENLAKFYAGFQCTSSRDDATIQWNDSLKLRVITKALRSHGRFAIALTLIEANHPFRESDIVLLDYMSYYLITAFDFGHTSLSEENSPMSLATVLTQLLKNEPVATEKVHKALNVFEWKVEHSYIVFFAKTPEPEHNFTTRIYQCQMMERQFASAIAIASIDENNAVVANTFLDGKIKESISRFDSVLQRFNFTCGMSCEFNDLRRVFDYYSQAKYACEYGNFTDPGKTIYDFSDYSLQYMLSHCCNGQDPKSLFPAGLKDIITYDQSNGTSYLKTLIAYCDSKFNATHAAEFLHIHRTTFLGRFTRICDFLNIDFDNPSDRLHLLMSLELLRKTNPDLIQ